MKPANLARLGERRTLDAGRCKTPSLLLFTKH